MRVRAFTAWIVEPFAGLDAPVQEMLDVIIDRVAKLAPIIARLRGVSCVLRIVPYIGGPPERSDYHLDPRWISTLALLRAFVDVDQYASSADTEECDTAPEFFVSEEDPPTPARACFRVSSAELSEQAICDLMSKEPTRRWNAGDAVLSRFDSEPILMRENAWEIEAAFAGVPLDKCIAALFPSVAEVAPLLADREGLRCSIHLEQKFSYGSVSDPSWPDALLWEYGFGFTAEMIAILASLKATVYAVHHPFRGSGARED